MIRYLLACGLFFVYPAGFAASRAPDEAWVERHALTADEFAKASKEFAEKGYRMAQVSPAVVGKEVRFTALWERTPKDDTAREVRSDLTAEQYKNTAAELKEKGFRPVDVRGYELNGEVRFATIWEKAPKGDPAREVHAALTSDEYRKLYTDLINKGYKPLRLNGFAVGKEARYSTVWEKEPKNAPEWHARRDLTADQYQDEFDAQLMKGHWLVHVSGYTINGEERFAGIWGATPGSGWHAHHALSATEYEQRLGQLKSQGFRPVQLNAHALDGKLRFAGVWRPE